MRRPLLPLLFSSLGMLVSCGSLDVGSTGHPEEPTPTPTTPAAPEPGKADGNKSCPSGRGPSMARTARGCIDTTEVTQKQYAEFLAEPTPPAQPLECEFNGTFVPGQQAKGFVCSASLYDPTGKPNAPVRCVDWCDAKAFCAWAGKRLCGKIGGGSLTKSEYADPAKSEWMAACSSGGAQAYPYGPVFTPAACHGGPPQGFADPFDTGSAPSCVGGPAGVFDMSGNAGEWEDACDGAKGTGDSCRVRGGDTRAAADALACDADSAATRGSMGSATGIRCCAD